MSYFGNHRKRTGVSGLGDDLLDWMTGGGWTKATNSAETPPITSIPRPQAPVLIQVPVIPNDGPVKATGLPVAPPKSAWPVSPALLAGAAVIGAIILFKRK